MNPRHKVWIASITCGVTLLVIFMLIVIPRVGMHDSKTLTEAQKIKAFLDTNETKEILDDAEKTCQSKFISATNRKNIEKYLGKLSVGETTLVATKADFDKLKQSNQIAKAENAKSETLAKQKKESEDQDSEKSYAGMEGERIFSNSDITITNIDDSHFQYRCKTGEQIRFYVEEQIVNGVKQDPFTVNGSVTVDQNSNYDVFHGQDKVSSDTSGRTLFAVGSLTPVIYTDSRGKDHAIKDRAQVPGTNRYRVKGRITKSYDKTDGTSGEEIPDGRFDITIHFQVPEFDADYAARLREQNQEDETKENETTTSSTNKIPSRTPDTNGDPAAGSTFRPFSEKTYQLGTINADTVNFRFFNNMDDKVLVKGDKLWISTQKTQQIVGGKQQTFRLVGYIKTAEWGWVAEDYIDFVN